MRRRRIILGGLLTVVAIAILAGGAAVVIARRGSSSPVSPGRTVAVNCRSAALGGSLPVLVYLPPGYSRSSGPYPVVYFLHGLPASPDSYQSNSFVAGALRAAGERAIVVAPQGARDNDHAGDAEYLDWSPTENWPRAVAQDLPRCVDSRYHTIAGRLGRALIGLSAGGYGAFNIGLRHLDRFAAVESWSGYFSATDPSGDHVLDLGSPQANAAATVLRGKPLAGELRRSPSLLAFYVGRQDERFLDMNQSFDASLRSTRIGHLFRVYDGGHSAGLWHSQAPHWLKLALDYLNDSRQQR